MRRRNLARTKPFAGLAFGLILAACATTVDTRGYIPEESAITQLKKGVDSRQTVVDLLGSPSSVATFDDATWYYIGKKTERFAFLNEKVVDQKILAIAFDGEGLLSEVHLYTIEDGRIIDPVTRETPTHGRELNLLEQLFGNIGRFSNRPGSQ